MVGPHTQQPPPPPSALRLRNSEIPNASFSTSTHSVLEPSHTTQSLDSSAEGTRLPKKPQIKKRVTLRYDASIFFFNTPQFANVPTNVSLNRH